MNEKKKKEDGEIWDIGGDKHEESERGMKGGGWDMRDRRRRRI